MNVWRNLKASFVTPSPKSMLQRQLDDSLRERVEATKLREEWEAQEQLLLRRIDRIKQELSFHD